MQKNKAGIILSIITFLLGVILPILLFNLGNTFNYVIKPLIWTFLFALVVVFLKKTKKAYNFNKNAIIEVALITSLIYIIIYFSLGLIIGYSKSPYDRSFIGIIKNIWVFIPFIVFREIVRDHIIKSSKKNSKLLIVLITVIMVFTDISFNSFQAYSKTIADIIEFSVKTFLPAICLNVYLSYLCVKESYKSSITYIVPIILLRLISPVFPYNLFFVTIVVDLTIPFVSFMKIESLYSLSGIVSIYKKKDKESIIRKIVSLVIIVLVLLFTTRLLPVSPIVIVSNSMVPYMERGDIAIIQKKESSKIKINDIIEYRLGDTYIIHRVVNIKNINNEHVFITKGDNNSSPDSKSVKSEQINGIVIGYIPKIGYPTIWIRDFLENVRGIRVKEGDRV